MIQNQATRSDLAIFLKINNFQAFGLVKYLGLVEYKRINGRRNSMTFHPGAQLMPPSQEKPMLLTLDSKELFFHHL